MKKLPIPKGAKRSTKEEAIAFFEGILKDGKPFILLAEEKTCAGGEFTPYILAHFDITFKAKILEINNFLLEKLSKLTRGK